MTQGAKQAKSSDMLWKSCRLSMKSGEIGLCPRDVGRMPPGWGQPFRPDQQQRCSSRTLERRLNIRDVAVYRKYAIVRINGIHLRDGLMAFATNPKITVAFP